MFHMYAWRQGVYEHKETQAQPVLHLELSLRRADPA